MSKEEPIPTEISQAIATSREFYISTTYSFYKRCQEEGFNQQQSFRLAEIYMIELINAGSNCK